MKSTRPASASTLRSSNSSNNSAIKRWVEWTESYDIHSEFHRNIDLERKSTFKTSKSMKTKGSNLANRNNEWPSFTYTSEREEKLLPRVLVLSWPEYRQLQHGDILLTIEHCCDCDHHLWGTHHDEDQYRELAYACLDSIKDVVQQYGVRFYSMVKTIRDAAPYAKAFKPLYKVNPTHEDLKDPNYIPLDYSNRLGAFEIQLAVNTNDSGTISHILHSKIFSRKWPKIPDVLLSCESLLEDIGFRKIHQKMVDVLLGSHTHSGSYEENLELINNRKDMKNVKLEESHRGDNKLIRMKKKKLEKIQLYPLFDHRNDMIYKKVTNKDWTEFIENKSMIINKSTKRLVIEWTEYQELRHGDVLLTIEHCCGCDDHDWGTHHDEDQYRELAYLFQDSVRDVLQQYGVRFYSMVKTIRDAAPYAKAFKPLYKVNPTHEDLKDPNYIPLDYSNRLGAFEIQLAVNTNDSGTISHILHSKIFSRKWPKIPDVLLSCESLLEDIGFRKIHQKMVDLVFAPRSTHPTTDHSMHSHKVQNHKLIRQNGSKVGLHLLKSMKKGKVLVPKRGKADGVFTGMIKMVPIFDQRKEMEFDGNNHSYDIIQEGHRPMKINHLSRSFSLLNMLQDNPPIATSPPSSSHHESLPPMDRSSIYSPIPSKLIKKGKDETSEEIVCHHLSLDNIHVSPSPTTATATVQHTNRPQSAAARLPSTRKMSVNRLEGKVDETVQEMEDNQDVNVVEVGKEKRLKSRNVQFNCKEWVQSSENMTDTEIMDLDVELTLNEIEKTESLQSNTNQVLEFQINHPKERVDILTIPSMEVMTSSFTRVVTSYEHTQTLDSTSQSSEVTHVESRSNLLTSSESLHGINEKDSVERFSPLKDFHSSMRSESSDGGAQYDFDSFVDEQQTPGSIMMTTPKGFFDNLSNSFRSDGTSEKKYRDDFESSIS